MHDAATPPSFLCTLPAADKGIAYHVAVSFAGEGHPSGVRFTSFVGDGRRSFAVLTGEVSLHDGVGASCEALCRVAIGQAVRDHLYGKLREGDFLLDQDAVPWEGELRKVGLGPASGRQRPRLTR